MKVNKEILDEYVDKKLLRVGKHPKHDLYIYNYSKHTEFNNHWDEITRTCRGLVIDSDGNVYAKPFDKFFNMEQEDPELIKKLYNERVSFEIFEKMDGFLGIGFMYNGEFIISSRGSFESRPCEKANEIWNKRYAPYIKPMEGFTYIFEIIYNEDKIVVDYDFEDLILLGINHHKSGEEVPHTNFKFPFTGNINKRFPRIVKKVEGISDFRKLREEFPDKNNGQFEGFVIRFGDPYDGFRIKLKYSEYFRLSKVLTGVSTKSIWEFLKDKKDFSEMLELVPDEFYNWVKEERESLENKYHEIANEAIEEFRTIYYNEMEKIDLVKVLDENKYSKFEKGLMFAQYDLKFDRFEESIWSKIKPEFQKAFLNPLEDKKEN